MSDVSSKDLAVEIAQIADEKKADDVIIISVGDVLSITEYFVLTSANNRRLVGTVADEVTSQIRERYGRSPLRTEGVAEQQWVLVDYGDVVVHVFAEETRRYYEIERLYKDVPKVDWKQGGMEARDSLESQRPKTGL
jgi:ribosome-associated protein